MITWKTNLHMRAIPALAAIVLAICVLAPAEAAEPDSDVLGTWQLTEVLDSSEISSIDDRQAKNLVGKQLRISKDEVEFAGETCRGPDFVRSQEQTALYLRENAHVAASRLGLPDPVTVVSLTCTEIFLKGTDKIVVHWKGFFFDAIRVSPKTHGKYLKISSVAGCCPLAAPKHPAVTN